MGEMSLPCQSSGCQRGCPLFVFCELMKLFSSLLANCVLCSVEGNARDYFTVPSEMLGVGQVVQKGSSHGSRKGMG